MGVDVNVYRMRIGMFNRTTLKTTKVSSFDVAIVVFGVSCGALSFILTLLTQQGIEPNPGPWTLEAILPAVGTALLGMPILYMILKLQKQFVANDRTNFVLMSRLLLDVCGGLLREVLKSKTAPDTLAVTLQKIQQGIPTMYKKQLYPPGGFKGSYENLDVSILCSVLRNLGFNTIPPHRKGWGRDPDPSDNSLSANIDRIRCQRNEGFGHVKAASMSDRKFKEGWDIIRRCVEEIQKSEPAIKTDYLAEMDRLKKEAMNSKTEHRYIEQFRELSRTVMHLRGDARVIIEAHSASERNFPTRDIQVFKETVAKYLGIDVNSIKSFRSFSGSSCITFGIKDYIGDDVSALDNALRVKDGLLDGPLVLKDSASAPFYPSSTSIEASLVLPNSNNGDKKRGALRVIMKAGCRKTMPKISKTQREEMINAIAKEVGIDVNRIEEVKIYTGSFILTFLYREENNISALDLAKKMEKLPEGTFNLMDDIQLESIDLSLVPDMNEGLPIYKQPGRSPSDVERMLALKYKVSSDKIVPALRPNSGDICFIVYDENGWKDVTSWAFGHKIFVRNPKNINPEGFIVNKYCSDQNLHLEKEQKTLLRNAMQKYGTALFSSHSNINAISWSPIKSTKNGKQCEICPCIVIYCCSKGFIPVDEKPFPKMLNLGESSVVVDVREGYFEFGPNRYETSHSHDFHSTLKLGCQFGEQITKITGTVGPFVEFEGQVAFLTCAHIIYGVDPNGYTYGNIVNCPRVEQPSSGNFSFQPPANHCCGEVRRAVFLPQNPCSVDAAIGLITDNSRIPSHAEFAVDKDTTLQSAGFDELPDFDSGKIHEDPTTIDSDKRIVKFGSETHVTRGTLISDGTMVRPLSTELGCPGVHGNKISMTNQMEIGGVQGQGNFFKSGDSGSGVFFVNKRANGVQELVCIGMAIGSLSNGNGIVTPIAPILDALKLPRRLLNF